MSGYDPEHHHRRSIRLKGYDYSRCGAYFITICTHDRACLFGDVVAADMRVNEYGQIVEREWTRTPDVRREIALDAHIVMPNHVHGIVVIETPRDSSGSAEDASGAPRRSVRGTGGGAGASGASVGTTGRSPLHAPRPRGPGRRSLASFIGGFKSAVTSRINGLRHAPGETVWQRDYYEHIIRNEKEWDAIVRYIAQNPANWPTDPENPLASSSDDDLPFLGLDGKVGSPDESMPG